MKHHPSMPSTVTRRHFLRAVGITLVLPVLESLQRRGYAAGTAKPARRLVAICAPLGIHTPFLFPEKAGRGYEPTPYLETLKEFQGDLTVISGLAHPGVGSTHDSIYSFLTAAKHPEVRAGFRNSISLDQFAAEKIGDLTRFPSLSLSAEGFGLSWTRSGALVPSDVFPASVFARLFLEGKPDEVQAQARRLRDGQSILDTVQAQAQSLQGRLGSRDREKMDEYFTSVRELERRMVVAEEWSRKPKPKVDVPPPQNNTNPADLIGKTRLMFDLMHLALQTDSTRLITLELLGTSLVPPIPGVTLGHHDLSHHGQDPKKIEQLRIVEAEEMKALRDFLDKLKKTDEQGESLLDRTMVYFSSNLGNAANHSTKNLPVVLAGGGFNHGQHLAFEANGQTDAPPLSNLYVTMLQRLGIDADKFGSSTGTLTGLDPRA
jgi:hypothetical protein